MLAPLSGLLLFFTFWSMFKGLVRTQTETKPNFFTLLNLIGQTIRGMIYMLHWQIVMASITARMSVRPKRLKWVKTVHEGTTQESFEF